MVSRVFSINTKCQIPVYQRKRLPRRKFYGRAGAFFLYCVLSGGKGQLASVGQGDIGGQIGGNFKLIGYGIAVITQF